MARKGMVDFTRTLGVAGMMHIISNATQDLGRHLSRFGPHVTGLKQICHLLTDPWRSRFVESCMRVEGVTEADRKSVRHFHASVYEERWGTVVDANHQILKLKRILVSHWDADRYSFDMRHQAPVLEPNSKRLSAEAVDAVIRSKAFWGYARCLEEIARCLHALDLWVEGCSCHDPHWDPKAAEACPLRGMRAAELAAGAMHHHLNVLSSKQTSELLAHLDGVSDDDKSAILQDFCRARALLQCIFRIKTSHWEVLPHSLCAAAHDDQDVARCALKKALAAYEATPPEKHHGMSNWALSHGTRLREEIVRFCAGEARETLPVLMAFAARLRFISIVERRCESLHARVQRYVVKAPSHSPMHVAFSLLKRSLVAKLLENSQFVADLDS